MYRRRVRFEMMEEGEAVMARLAMRIQRWAVAAAGLIALSGCSGFFVPVKPGPGPGPDNGGSGSTLNLAYVANTMTSTVSGFAVGTGTLTSVPNMPFAIGFTPLTANC